MPKKNQSIKLNLGCGFDKRPGYVNLDVDPRVKPDKVHDLLDPLPYSINSVAEILLQDVLEHFTKEDGEKLLIECLRVLQPGGRLFVRVPYPQAILSKFQAQEDLLMLYLYGDTSRNGVWGAHKYGYSPDILEEIGDRLGFTVLKAQVEDTNWKLEIVKSHLTESGSDHNIKIMGYVTEWFEKELQEQGGSWIVLTKLWQQLWLTLPLTFSNRKVAWWIEHPAPSLIAKTVLRWLSKRVKRVGFEEKKQLNYVTTMLQYSHLRILDGSKPSKSIRK